METVIYMMISIMGSNNYKINEEVFEYDITWERVFDIARIGISLLTYDY